MRQTGQTSTTFVDRYSALHFLAGVAMYGAGLSFIASLVLHVLFEFWENTETVMLVTRSIPVWPGGKEHADYPVNTFGDVVFGQLGWLSAHWLATTTTAS